MISTAAAGVGRETRLIAVGGLVSLVRTAGEATVGRHLGEPCDGGNWKGLGTLAANPSLGRGPDRAAWLNWLGEPGQGDLGRVV